MINYKYIHTNKYVLWTKAHKGDFQNSGLPKGFLFTQFMILHIYL